MLFFFSCFSAAVIPFKGRKTNRAKDARNFGCLCNQTTSIVFFSFFPFLFLFFLLFVVVVDVVIFLVAIFLQHQFQSQFQYQSIFEYNTANVYLFIISKKNKKRKKSKDICKRIKNDTYS